MTKGIIQDTVLRVEKCAGFNLNPVHEIERREQENDFVRWCRKPINCDLRPDTNEYMGGSLLTRLTMLIP